MNNLTVKEIVTIYSAKNNTTWQRSFFDTRKSEGIVFFTEGEIRYHFDSKDFTAKGGDILLMPSNLPYSGEKLSEAVSFYAIDFLCISGDELSKIGAPLVLKSKSFDRHLAAFRDIVHSWTEKLTVSDFEIKAFIYTVLAEIYKQEENLRNATPTDEILKFISENISNQALSVKEICNNFYISESQLRRNVYKRTGLSPNEYVNALRINKARGELRETDKTVAEVALECGFSSPYYFSKVFSKIVGVSPREYRATLSNGV